MEVLRDYYWRHREEVCDDCRRRLERNPLRVLDCKAEVCQPIIEAAPPILTTCVTSVRPTSRASGSTWTFWSRPYTLNHRLVRGLDYYTKTVFEVWAAGIGAQAAVCGGGRYDGLAEILGGPPTPGVGVAAGLERIILAMKSQGIPAPPIPAPPVFLAHLGDAARREAVRLADALRQAGVGVLVAFGERGLKSQMREADKRGARFVVILGEDELARGVAAVRDMAASEQIEVPLEELVPWLRERVVL